MRLFISSVLVLAFIGRCLAAQCACSTGNVNVRSGASLSNSVLTVLRTGNCLPYRGDQTTSGGITWAHVNYNNQNGWISTSYVRIGACSGGTTSGGSGVQLPGCPRIITRSQWHAAAPSSTIGHLSSTPRYVFIHHGASPACFTEATCTSRVQGYQRYHMQSHGWSDIGYSFVVGEDGNVYEARGWDEIGAHTYGYNSVGLGICIIGDFTSKVPNSAALSAVKQLIDCGVRNNKISATYTLRGHRDMGSTSCPGTKLYELIKTWPHYT
ncbi:hypothetical protein ScPMuIL_003306 [Solemya velum]